MENRNIFKNLSPLDHRYYLSNKELFDRLSEHLSEEASIAYCLEVETALLTAHISRLVPDQEERDRLVGLTRRAVSGITPDEVYAEEEKTQHNIRALVNIMKAVVPDEVRHLVHLGATSVDILDTAASLKIRAAVRKVVLPLLLELEERLVDLAETEAETPQVGRTHGQHAVPITFGFAVAEYVSRLGGSIREIERRSGEVRGKFAGAVGAYNSTSMLVPDPEELEREVLGLVGLEPSEHSTQLVEPEYLLRLLLELNVAFGVIANLADDLRHLQRSEISEVRERFGRDQVGSSTMPQKRNPWNSEHVKSLWKAFAPRVVSFYMDQISEHQRDLTNSASSRFVAEYIAGFTAAAARMKRVLESLTVDRERLSGNLSGTGDGVLAEPAYILLSRAGEPDAHEIIRKKTLECEERGIRLVQALTEDSRLWKTITEQLRELSGPDPETFFSHPELYYGRAPEKAKALAAEYRREIQTIREVLKR